MLFYASTIICATFFAYAAQKSKSISRSSQNSVGINRSLLYFLSFITLFIVTGFRKNVGVDYPAYTNLYTQAVNGKELNFEFGFKMLNNILVYFSDNPQLIFIVSAILMLSFLYITVMTHSKNPALSIFLFCSMSFLFYSFNATRQFIAVAIILYGWKSLVQRDLVRYIMLIGLASMFHRTALLLIPIYMIVNYRFRIVHYISIGIISAFGLLFKVQLTRYMLKIYPLYEGTDLLTRQTGPSEIFIASLLILSILMAIMIRKRMISRDNTEIRISMNLLFIMALMHIIFTWIPMADRLSLYVDIYLVLIIPLILSHISNKKWKIIITLGFIFYTSVYTYVSVAINDSHKVLPYDNVLINTYPRTGN